RIKGSSWRLDTTRNGKNKFQGIKKVKIWIYVQRITPTKKKDNVQLRVVNYILYGNGKPTRGISDASIQLVRTCLVLNWDHEKKSSSIEEARASFVEIRTNGLIRDFLRINLVKSPISYNRKRNDPSDSGLISENGSDRTNINPFSSTYSYSKARIEESLNQNQGTIHTLLNRNKECQSLIILSSSNCSRMGPFNDVKYHNHNVIKESIKKDPLIPIRNLLGLGPLGTALQIPNFYLFSHLITHNQILVTNYAQLENFRYTFQEWLAPKTKERLPPKTKEIVGFGPPLKNKLFWISWKTGCNLLATPHIESKYKGLKIMHYVVTDMLGSSGFGWNETLHSVESHPEANGLLNKPLFKYDQLGFIFGKDRATGKAAEAPGDAVEDLDREEGTIGLDDMDMSVPMTGSATQSTRTKPIKKRRTRGSMTDGFTSGLQNLTAVFGTYMEATGKRMEMLAERLGHAKDASLDRKKVYEELCRIDFASELDRLQVTQKIVAKQDIVNVFLCLPDDAKASYAHMLLNTDV
ncbi:hypothetical protein RJ640_014000, partial [Escallonia rubra]